MKCPNCGRALETCVCTNCNFNLKKSTFISAIPLNISELESLGLFILNEEKKTAELKRRKEYDNAYRQIKKATDVKIKPGERCLNGLFLEGYGKIQNFEEAAKNFLRGAEQGDDIAQCLLGLLYRAGSGVEKSYAKVYEMFSKSAMQGNAEAEYELSYMYLMGEGIEQNYSKAYELALKSAERGNKDAAFMLSFISFVEGGVDISYTQDDGIIQRAAEQGNAKAQFVLGLWHWTDGRVEIKENGYKMLTRSAEQGFAEAEYMLGIMYLRGEVCVDTGEVFIEQSRTKAYELLSRAANHGCVGAKYQLGLLYKEGQGVEKDYTKAFEMFLQSLNECKIEGEAKYSILGLDLEQRYDMAYKEYYKSIEKWKDEVCKGKLTGQIIDDFFEFMKKEVIRVNTIEEAEYQLGLLYKGGKGIEQNYIKAFEMFSNAAKQGNEDAEFELGLLYLKGQGVEQNSATAYEIFSRLASQGNTNGVYGLGLMYKEGRGVEQSYTKAYELFLKSANQGNANGEYELGLMYKKGIAVEQSFKKAFELFYKSAEQGNANGEYELGRLYRKGQGVEQSYKKAYELFLKSANQGNTEAESALGWLYYNGEGVEQSYDKAILWLNKALEHEKSKEKMHLKISIERDIAEDEEILLQKERNLKKRDEEQLIQFEIEYQKIKDRYWRTDEYIIRIQSVLRNINIDKAKLKKFYDEAHSYLLGDCMTAEEQLKILAERTLMRLIFEDLSEKVIKDKIRKFEEGRKKMQYFLKCLKDRLDYGMEENYCC